MRKSINLVVGVFLFVLVFSFFGLKSNAEDYASSLSISENDFNKSFTGTSSSERYPVWPKFDFGVISYSNNIDPDSLYEVEFSFSLSGSLTAQPHWQYVYFPHLHWGRYSIYYSDQISLSSFTSGITDTVTYFVYGSDLIAGRELDLEMLFQNNVPYSTTLSVSCSFDIVSVIPVNTEDQDLYEQGYNAGYQNGYNQGQSNGYSSGYSSGYQEGETSGYNSGYQAGVNSVDTQSYYDAGYSAGESAGYSAGYDNGYDTGYAAALERFESWGSDTTNYPILIYDVNMDDGRIDFLSYNDGYATFEEVNDNNFYKYSFTADYFGSNTLINTYDNLNPNHIYKIVLTDYYASLAGSGYFYLDIGSNTFKFAEISSDYKRDVFVFSEGSNLGSSISFRVEGIARYNNTGYSSNYVYFNKLQIYDYGPVGNTQNHIANQTDDLTNGYDSSAGESASNKFANDASSYEQAESNIFTSAKQDLNNFQFYDIGSNSSVLVGLSFVSSMMTAIFGAMGGITGGAGIVLSVLFSVMLVSIVIGTYRYFVSSGKTGKSSSRKGGKG